MSTRTVTKWFGAVVAALTLSMVTSVSPASAASAQTGTGDRVHSCRDSGWGAV